MRHLLLAFILLVSADINAEIAVVVDIKSPVDKVDQREVANIFLAKTNRFPDGRRVRPIELSDDGIKASFYYKISGKTLPQINSYWTTLIFTGKGKPPRNIDKTPHLIEMLRNDPQAITYLPLEQITDSMRVIHILH